MRRLLPPAFQVAAVLMVVAAVVEQGYFVTSRVWDNRVPAEAKAAAAQIATANTPLQHEVVSLRRKLDVIARDRWRAAQSEADSLRDRFSAAQPHEPAGIPRPIRLIASGTAQAVADPTRTEVVISDAPGKAEQESLGEVTRRSVGELRRLLASTGLNIERLFPQLGGSRGEGGPFVVPSKGDPPRQISRDQLETIRGLIRSLPLSAPLDSYQLESPFGPRNDPFRHRAAFHTGIDLSAPYMSPVYATAAGTVVYAGYLSDYGKVVEIDHGNGIATVYGHLHRYIVSVGQKVAEHDQIGYLGSTGRSSGPHVHYEVRVNDEPQDPEKFIGLARVMPAADKPPP
ncbi:MAG TPA: M23 family metallopeptidase [Stellaceae bacterium]|nr:M23 family metallopeptidase [Stellaceae bacterium]